MSSKENNFQFFKRPSYLMILLVLIKNTVTLENLQSQRQTEMSIERRRGRQTSSRVCYGGPAWNRECKVLSDKS